MASINLSLRPPSSFLISGSKPALPIKIRPHLGWSSRVSRTKLMPTCQLANSQAHTCPLDANLGSSIDSTCSNGKQPLHVPARAVATAAMIAAIGFQMLTPQSALASAAGSMAPQPSSTSGQTSKADIFPKHIAAMSMGRASHNKAGALFYVLHYRMLQVLSLPTVGKVAALVAVGAPLVVGGAAMHRWASGAPWPESLLKVYYVLNSVPGIDISAEQTKRAVFVLNLMHVASLFTFAILVGILTDEVARGVEAVRTGNHAVPEKHHTVILGWDRARTPLLLQQLLQAQAERERGAVRPPFVLLLDPARCSKEEVDQLLEDKMGQKLGRIVVTRQGSALRPDDLKRVSAGQAGTIIVTANPSTDSQLDSTSTLLATLAALHSVADPKTKQSVVVETSADVADWDTTGGGGSICRMLSSQNRRVTTVTEAKEVAEIIAQTALHAGISAVFEEVCVQCKGHSEFYIKKKHDFVGRTFRDARLSYPGALLTGTVSRTTRVARLSPPEGYVLQPEDCLVFLAEDDHHIVKVSNPAAYEPPPLPASTKRAIEAAPAPHVVVLMHDAVDGAIQLITSLTTVGRDRPHITLVGKSPEQSSQRHAIETALSTVRHAGCKTDWIKEDCASQAACLRAGVATAQAVVIAPPGKSWGPDDTDAQVLACALQVLDVLHHSTSPRDAPLRLVTGIMTDGTRQVLQSMTASAINPDRPNHAMVAELLLKDRLMTGLLGQVATEPLLRGVFEELLSQEGAELYTRDQAYFDLPVDTPMTWDQVVEHVRLRGELAVGTVGQSGTVRLGQQAHDQGTLKPGTKLIVLADD